MESRFGDELHRGGKLASGRLMRPILRKRGDFEGLYAIPNGISAWFLGFQHGSCSGKSTELFKPANKEAFFEELLDDEEEIFSILFTYGSKVFLRPEIKQSRGENKHASTNLKEADS
jgi:hypothetical protein